MSAGRLDVRAVTKQFAQPGGPPAVVVRVKIEESL